MVWVQCPSRFTWQAYTSATSCWISSFLPVVFTPHTRRILKRLHFPQPNNIHVHRKLIYSPHFKSLAEIECKKPLLSEAIHCWKKRVLPLFRSLISSRGESRLCKSRDFGISTWSIDQFGISRTLGRFKSRPGSWGYETRSETETKEVRACFDSTLLLTTRFSGTDFC